MRRLALIGTLSARAKTHAICVLSDPEKISGKTKDLVKLFKDMQVSDKNVLLVVTKNADLLVRAARNIESVAVKGAASLSAHDALQADYLLFTKEALSDLEKRLES